MNSDQSRIYDDSHAKAILRGVMRKAREESVQSYEKTEARVQHFDQRKFSTTKSKYKFLYNLHLACIGDGLIYCGKKHGIGKREYLISLALGGLDLDPESSEIFDEERLLPVTYSVIDSKHPTSDFSGTPTIILEVTFHSLMRIVRRNQCRSLKEISHIVGHELVFVSPIFYDFSQARSGDYVYISGEGYAPFYREKDSIDLFPRHIVKTWIPKLLWKPDQEGKLSTLCRELSAHNESVVMTVNKFNKSALLTYDPLDRGCVYISKNNLNAEFLYSALEPYYEQYRQKPVKAAKSTNSD